MKTAIIILLSLAALGCEPTLELDVQIRWQDSTDYQGLEGLTLELYDDDDEIIAESKYILTATKNQVTIKKETEKQSIDCTLEAAPTFDPDSPKMGRAKILIPNEGELILGEDHSVEITVEY